MNNKQEGKIVRIISNLCTVKVDDKLYDCKPRGKFYIQNKIPLVGDRVIIDTDNNYILDILENDTVSFPCGCKAHFFATCKIDPLYL